MATLVIVFMTYGTGATLGTFLKTLYTSFQKQTLGSIEVGKLADMIVLGDDPLTFAPARFQELPIDVTIAGGQVVHTGAVRTPASAYAAGTVVSCSCCLETSAKP